MGPSSIRVENSKPNKSFLSGEEIIEHSPTQGEVVYKMMQGLVASPRHRHRLLSAPSLEETKRLSLLIHSQGYTGRDHIGHRSRHSWSHVFLDVILEARPAPLLM